MVGDPQDWEDIIAINLTGVFNVTGTGSSTGAAIHSITVTVS